ncbi:MAG TPA: O-antigen ligase family protein, partial [bacterium]|nr:O-antigen ligase family protein [bacterium]
MKKGKAKAASFIIESLWLVFFLSTAVLIDVKLYRLKLHALQLGSLILLAAAFFAELKKKEIRIPVLRTDAILFCYMAYLIFRYVISSQKPVAGVDLERYFLFGALYLTGRYYSPIKKTLLRYWVAAAFFIALYGLWQNFGGTILFVSVPRVSPPFATFGNQDFFAGYLLLIFPAALGIFREEKKIFFLAAFLLFLADLYLTGSRAAALGIPVALGFLLGNSYFPSFSAKKKVIASVLFLAGIISLVFFYRSFFFRDTTRLLIWRDTLRMALHHPFGVGPGEFRLHFPGFAQEDLQRVYPLDKFIVNFAHNEYLEILAEQGLPGLLLFFSFIFYGLVKGTASPFIKAGLLTALFQAFFSVEFRFTVVGAFFFLLFGLGMEDRVFREFRIKLDWKKRTAILLSATFLWGNAVFFSLSPFRAKKRMDAEKDFFTEKPMDTEGQIKKLEREFSSRAEYDTAYQLGWLLAKEKSWEKAVLYFRKAAELNPGSFGAMNNLGNIYFHTGQRAAAIHFWEKSLEI